MSSVPSADNARKISRNSLWYALDGSAATLVMLIASVPVARVMGPQVLGQYIFLVFVTGIAQRLGNVGIPATACKYMAEYLGGRQEGIAHEIYHAALRQQAVVATIVTTTACVFVHFLSAPDYRLVSYLIVLSMWPSMLNNIPAQANVAAENLGANIPASLVNCVSYAVLVVCTLVFQWGLVGLASATLLSRFLEAGVRYLGVRTWLRKFERVPLSSRLRQRMFTFSRQNLILLALGLVVWDRSELLFLKYFSSVTDVAYYSLAFSITKQLLMVPVALSSAIGVTIFAQAGRDRRRLEGLVRNATRYVALLAVPLFLGTAAVASPLIRFVYGQTYLPVIPVLWILCMFAIPRAFQVHTENLLQATETQGFTVRWMAMSAVVNIVFDGLLIPRYGAVGAAVANGLAQMFAVAGIWAKANSLLSITLPVRFLGRLILSGAAMVAVVVPIGIFLRPTVALPVCVVTGVLVFAASLRVSHLLEDEDWIRLHALLTHVPPRLRGVADFAARVLLPKVPAGGFPGATTAARPSAT